MALFTKGCGREGELGFESWHLRSLQQLMNSKQTISGVILVQHRPIWHEIDLGLFSPRRQRLPVHLAFQLMTFAFPEFSHHSLEFRS
jgi:hypothetical protein